jgi:hypothetical protein
VFTWETDSKAGLQVQVCGPVYNAVRIAKAIDLKKRSANQASALSNFLHVVSLCDVLATDAQNTCGMGRFG